MESDYNSEVLEYNVIEKPNETYAKQLYWDFAIGLQKVDGLSPSKYMENLIGKNINGEIDNNKLILMLKEYYNNQNREKLKENEKECDLVSARIVELIDDSNFDLSVSYLKNIHEYLFQDIYEFNGQFRKVDISKNEIILNGDTVTYADNSMIEKTLNYDIGLEKQLDCKNMNIIELINHITDFASCLWQVHPFREGNTRTTALFIIKYLNSLGYNVKNDLFKENSVYFRNALVRSCYYNNYLDIKEDNSYLIRFFENLILGKHNNLQSKDLMIAELFEEEEKMQNFKELDKRDVHEVESSILKKWQEENILQKTIDNREGKENWVFYDGPIYANAKPGIHHVLAKAIKDSFCKYQTMNGKRVLRKIGLDTHGLPIEVNVEKKLGFRTKADIEEFGVENFCKECNKATALNIDEINNVTNMMGQFIDCENPYVTCSNEYIESEWWIIKEIEKKGLLYHGNKVLWYCPRCGTELSANEVSQGYEETSVNTVIVPLKQVDDDVYFLAWTTTPWTLMANVAICVNPELTYVKCESLGYKFIVAESLADKVLGEDYQVLETYKGKDLVGIKYEQLMPFVTVEGKAHEVIADNYVTAEDGTGIVHIAPAYGADDNRVCRENGIGFVNPVGLDGCYTEGPWKGTLVTDPNLEIEIIKWLKENDKLFKKIKITHDYPHCWRCHSPLISYPKPAWYVNTTAYKDKIIAANKKINWYPEYVGEKRFSNWLENMVDWGISRNRYWGCPLPIWQCECGCHHVVGSLDELQAMVIEDINVRDIELHRPYVDDIHLKCPDCGQSMTRVKDVLDVWFDSGSMPYAQFHYPFENKELFESQFPADFIAEGLDQTRGWFYVLLVISTIISGESSFKNVVVNDMVLDQYGKKMSKSVGNVVDPTAALTQYGADNVRWYMFYASPVWTPLKYDDAGIKEVYSKFFNPLRNTYSFFQMYANIDKIDTKDCYVDYEKREEIDLWLLSKYNKLIKDVRASFDEYDLNKVVHYLASFVSEDLSNWYIRRNRNRFWGSELNDSKRSVYITTYEVLVGIAKLIAPIVPYISEELYCNLTGEESVHLADYPVCNESLINEHVEEKMDLVRELISIGRQAREEAKIKVRQPISEVIIDGKNKEILGDLTNLIKEELNVKNITFANDLSVYMNFTIKPNFKTAGPIFGANIKDFVTVLNSYTQEEIKELQAGEEHFFEIDDKQYPITLDMVDIRINAKEGFDVGTSSNNFVILNTNLTKELIEEGIAREFISKIQNLRKASNFEIENRIITNVNCIDEDLKSALENNKEYIKRETLTVELNFVDNKLNDKIDINGSEISVQIIKN